jgi:hypothetical protein
MSVENGPQPVFRVPSGTRCDGHHIPYLPARGPDGHPAFSTDMPCLTARDTNFAENVSTNILFLKGQIVYLNLPVTIMYYLLMLRTAANSMPANPSPKDVISITAGRRPAAKDPNIPYCLKGRTISVSTITSCLIRQRTAVCHTFRRLRFACLRL